MDESKEIVPYFPLGVFLLPGEDLPLRIFEPRYKQLIEDIRESGKTFVIPYVKDSEIQQIGCEVRIKEVVAENPGGRMVITIEALSIVEVLSFSRVLGEKLYSGGAIRRLPGSDTIRGDELKRLISQYKIHFDAEFLSCCEVDHATYYDLLCALNLPSEEKFRFVSMSDKESQTAFLKSQLRYLMMIRHQELLLGNDFGLN